MRGLTMTGLLTGLAMLPGLAAAAPGAPAPGMAPAVGQPMRPGGWGPGGWQAGPGMGPRPGQAMPQPGRPGGFVGRPGGFPGGYHGGHAGYSQPFVGYVLPRTWYQPNYYIGNWGGYGLSQPYAGTGWYRYYDDAVLVDGRGAVRDWRGGIDWDGARGGDGADGAYDDGYEDGFDDGVDYAEDAVSYRGRMTRSKDGRGPGYDRSVAGTPYAPPHPPLRPGYGYDTYRSGGYGYAAGPGATVYGSGGATVVVIQSAPAVTTTTTTTTSYETVRSPKRVWHAPACRCAPAKPRGKMLRR